MEKSTVITNTSYHEFLMPFFVKKSKDIENNFDLNNFEFWEKVNEEIYFYFKAENNNSRANQNQRYGIKCGKENYFNNSARELLGLFDNDVCTQYRRKYIENSKLTISKDQVNYELDVLNVLLYKTEFDTFLLRITTKYNHKKENGDLFTAFRKINDYGRRIYLSNVSEYGEENAKSLYTADSISIRINEIEKKAEFKPKYNKLDSYSSEVLNYLLYGDTKCLFEIGSCLDDRMFVCASLFDDESYNLFNLQSDYICKITNSSSMNIIDEKIDEELYKLIYVDGDSCTCCDKYKRNRDVANALYTRWMPYSLYSITDYSYLHLTGDIGEDGYYLIDNDINIYGDMAVLALLQRSTVLYVSNYLDEEDNMNHKIVRLMKDINIMEASEQIQGIEMYEMFKKKMNIERDISLLNNQLSAIHARDTEEVNDNLGLFALAFTVINTANSILSMDGVENAIKLKKAKQLGINLQQLEKVMLEDINIVKNVNLDVFFAKIILALICGFLYWISYNKISNAKTKQEKTNAKILSIILFIITIILNLLPYVIDLLV